MRKRLAVFLAVALIGIIAFSFVPVSNVTITTSDSHLSISTDIVLAVNTIDEPASNPVDNPPMTWWNDSYEQRVNFTINSSDIDTTLTNFPTLLQLGTSVGENGEDISCIFDELNSDANRTKLAIVYANTTQCYVEIERWDDTNETASLWVNATTANSSVSSIYSLYYDKDVNNNTAYVGDTNSVPAEKVWDANYVGVWHMADGANTSHIYDSTDNNNDGTKEDANEPIEAAGKIDKCQSFDNTDDYILVSDSAELQITGDLTVEAWIKTGATHAGNHIYNAYNNTNPYPGFAVAIDGAGSALGKMSFYSDSDTWRYSSSTYNDDVWHAVAVVLDSTTVRFYDDGATDGTDTSAAPSSYDGDRGIGAKYVGTNQFDGEIDELRLSNIKRLPAHIKASYESGRDHLLDWAEIPEPPSISNTPASHDFGIVNTSSTYTTGLTNFNVTNDGNCTINISIKGTNMTGYEALPGSLSLITDYDVTDWNNDGLQGIVTDDTYLYATYNSKICKTPKASPNFTNPVAENLTANTEGIDVQQINTPRIEGDYLVLTGINTITTKLVVIKRFYTSNLTFYDEVNITTECQGDLGDHPEGVELHNGLWWMPYFHREFIDTYNASWKFQSEYAVSGIGHQSLQWVDDDYIWVSAHDPAVGDTIKPLKIYEWTGSGFTLVKTIYSPVTFWEAEGAWKEGDVLWWAEVGTDKPLHKYQIIYNSTSWTLNDTATPGADIYGLKAGLNSTTAIEPKKPSDFTDSDTNWNNETQAYDVSTPNDQTTAADSSTAPNDIDPWVTFHTWGAKEQTYTATKLNVNWKTDGLWGNDQIGISYTKDGGGNWTALVALAVHNEATMQTSSADLDANQNLTQVQVKALLNRVGGGDDGHLYIYDIWTNGTYTAGGDYDITVKRDSPYNNLCTDLSVNATQGWGLKLYTPTSYSDGYEKSGVVTLTATEV